MQINLKEYFKKSNKVIEFLNKEFVISADECEDINSQDLKLIDDIKVSGNILVSNDLIRLDLDVLAKFEFICSRCLCKFPYDLNLKCDDEILLNNLDEDIILDSDENLDFTNYIKNYIIVNIPQKKLCKVDCLGLCHVCGINLNDNVCNCKKDGEENAFSKLKDIFFETKEV